MQHDEDGQNPIAPIAPPAQKRFGERFRKATSSPESSHRVVLLAIVGLFLVRLPLLPRRLFDPDEFEHSHAAWCLFKGMLPYRDFFEHHTPWYYYLQQPFFRWFAVDESFESATHFLWAGRGLSFVLTIVSVFIVFHLGRLWADRRVGLVAGLLLMAQPFFLQKTLEMRPDVPALPFFLGGLWLLLRGLDRTSARTTSSTLAALGHFLGGGLLIGAAVMCTQKVLFVLPGAVVGLSLWALAGGRGGIRFRALLITVFLLGGAVPSALTWAAFALQHAGGEFIANNFLLNAKWNHTITGQMVGLIETSWPVLLLALVGTVAALRSHLRGLLRGLRTGVGFDAFAIDTDFRGVLLACTGVGLFAGVLVIPVAQKQYYLMPLPIVCLLAARTLSFLAERAQERGRKLIPFAIVALAILPVFGLGKAFLQRNDHQLERLQQVFEGTKPTDVVMDGWEGTGVFRPHAFFYFFLHEESVLMLPRARVDAYLDGLESGRIQPRMIAMDQHMAALGTRFLRFVERNYVSRDGFLYFSRGAFAHEGVTAAGIISSSPPGTASAKTGISDGT